METSHDVCAVNSFTPPQEYFSCINRSPGLASSYWDAFPRVFSQWLFRPFVRFTVTGVARNFHPYSLGWLSPAGALIGRRCTRYSFSYSIVWFPSHVKFYLAVLRELLIFRGL